MTETTKEKGTKVLVLGFDAGCGTCAEIARRVEERVGDQLSVRNLADPEVMDWREEALGKDAQWAPTLFEVEGDSVRAWTGRRMALPLSRKLGLSNTWQLMQVLGEMPNAGIPTLETASTTSAGMSRGKFLKGVGGAAVAMSVLSGVGPLVTASEAAKKKSPYDVIKTRRLSGAELMKTARRVGMSTDMRNMVGQKLSTPAKVKAAKPVGYMYRLRNGTARRLLIYRMSATLSAAHSEWTKPPKRMSSTRAMLLHHDNKRITVTKGSDAGRVWRRIARKGERQDTDTKREKRVTPLDLCPPVYGSKPPDNSGCWVKSQGCFEWNEGLDCSNTQSNTEYTCLTCLAATGLTLAGGLSAAVGLIACPYCKDNAEYNTEKCCTDQRTFWVYDGYCYVQ